MNPEPFIPGREYIIKGRSIYHPPGFGTEPKERDYTTRAIFRRSDGTRFYFDRLVLECDNKSNPSKSQFKLNGITIDSIVEVVD